MQPKILYSESQDQYFINENGTLIYFPKEALIQLKNNICIVENMAFLYFFNFLFYHKLKTQ